MSSPDLHSTNKVLQATILCIAFTLILVGFIGLSQQTAVAQQNQPSPPQGTQSPTPTPTPTPTPEPTPPPTIMTVEPVTQPDRTLKLVFNKPVKTPQVKIDGAAVNVFATSEPNKFELTVPSGTSVGRHQITATVEGGDLKADITVAPIILGLKTNVNAPLELSRVVVPGGEVIIQFNDKIPSNLRETLKVRIRETIADPSSSPQPGTQQQTPAPQQTAATPQQQQPPKKPHIQEISSVIVHDDYLLVTIPTDFTVGGVEDTTYVLEVIPKESSALLKETRIKIVYSAWMYVWATGIVLVLIGVIYGLYRFYKVISGSRPRYNFLKMLLLEQENQTYSLSRAQFLAWLVVIIWAYLFLYYAHGFIDTKWYFPNLGNAIYVFLISLGTLVVAQGTSLAQGAKGAGEEHPSLADLVVHGGVLALDRVQQVVWTLIALGMFIRITVSTYATADALPAIPTELVALMGLSSAGYLGGKMVRGAGPVIQQVTWSEGSMVLTLKGQHLSKDAFVWFDGAQVPKDKVIPKADDPDEPLKFAKELQVTLDITTADWTAKHHAITVVNPDAQRADWRTSAEIVSATAGTPGPDGKVPLTIKGARIASGATLEISGDPTATVKQDEKDPNLFTTNVIGDWPKQSHDLFLTSEGRKTTFNYKPTV